MKRSVVLIALCAPALAVADVIDVVDGSRLTGTLDAVTEGQVILSTAYAGVLSVDRAQVSALTVDQGRLVELASGERLVGRLSRAEDGQQVIETERFGIVSVDSQAIVAVLPLDGEGGASAHDDAAVAALESAYQAEVSDLKAQVEQLESPWSGSISVGLNGADGNSEEINLLVRGEALRETENDRFSAFLQQRFAEQNSARTSNEFLLGTRLEHDFADQSFLFGSLNLEVDEFENLDLRAILSAGYGRWFWEREDSSFKGLIGLGAQQENFDDGTSTTDALLELGYDYVKVASERLRFTHDLRYFPTFEDPGEDFRMVVNFGAEVAIDPDWAIKLGLRGDYNNLPPVGVDELDTSYFVNLLFRY